MNDVQIYLSHYYQNAEQFALSCAISPDTLTQLINEKLIPQPSYQVIAPDQLHSQAFGVLAAVGLTPGQYFHPGNRAWVRLALAATAESPEPHDALKARFRQNFALALKALDLSTYRLLDSFTATGDAIMEGLDARTEAAWRAFLSGIFSLCVRDPTSEQAIARKEILQEALNALAANSATRQLSAQECAHGLELIDQYAQVAMPFSPLEYPRSSRKRLVEDLSQVLRFQPRAC
jgi:hypothetical protein